jgi:hypothetical protein
MQIKMSVDLDLAHLLAGAFIAGTAFRPSEHLEYSLTEMANIYAHEIVNRIRRSGEQVGSIGLEISLPQFR